MSARPVRQTIASPNDHRVRGSANRTLRHIAVAALVAYTMLHVGYSLMRYHIVSGAASGDFLRVFTEAQRWKATGILDVRAVLYPPLYYALLAPLTAFDFRAVCYGFYGIQFVLFPMAIVFLVQAVPKGRMSAVTAYTVATMLTANFQPLLETLALHKVEGIEFVLIALAIALFRRRHDLWTGVLTFIAGNLKYLPGLLAIYFVLKREWRVVLGLGAALAVYFVVLTPVFGARTLGSFYVTYPMTMLLKHEQEGTRAEASLEFQTLTGTVNRWFVDQAGMKQHLNGQNYVPVPHAKLAFLIGGCFKLILLGLYVWYVRHRWRPALRERQWPQYLCEISLTLVLTFVIIPASRVHYAILLLPGFVVIGLLLYGHAAWFRWPEKLTFALAYALAGMIIPGGALNLLPPHPVWGKAHSLAYLWMSLPFYGYLVFALCVVLCDRRLRLTGAPPLLAHRFQADAVARIA